MRAIIDNTIALPGVVGANPVTWRFSHVLAADGQVKTADKDSQLLIEFRGMPRGRLRTGDLNGIETKYLQGILGRSLRDEEEITLKQAPNLFALISPTVGSPLPTVPVQSVYRDDPLSKQFRELMTHWNAHWKFLDSDGVTFGMDFVYDGLIGVLGALGVDGGLAAPTQGACLAVAADITAAKVTLTNFTKDFEDHMRVVHDLITLAAPPDVSLAVGARATWISALRTVWPFADFS